MALCGRKQRLMGLTCRRGNIGWRMEGLDQSKWVFWYHTVASAITFKNGQPVNSDHRIIENCITCDTHLCGMSSSDSLVFSRGASALSVKPTIILLKRKLSY